MGSQEIDPSFLGELEEDGWTPERRYYKNEKYFVKRSLRPEEYLSTSRGLYTPPLGKERLQNEAASLRFVQHETNLPVPKVHYEFTFQNAYYLVLDNIEGITLSNLPEEQKPPVLLRLDSYITALHRLKSNVIGGPSGLIVPPLRITANTGQYIWHLNSPSTWNHVFCHNDLSEANVIVDPNGNDIKAIIDWEYAGFYPEFFEAAAYTRKGSRAQATNDTPENIRRMVEFFRAIE